MIYKRFSYFFSSGAFAILFFLCGNVFAQSGLQYQRANQLMQEGDYQQAYSILNDLYRENPNSYPVYDHLIRCLVNLKNYDEAIAITKKRIGGNYKNLITAARLGELYHLKGDTTRAFEIWDQTLDAHKSQVQAYRYLAETLSQNQEYGKATEIFKKGRDYFHNNQLFIYEMAANYLQAGDYDKTIGEYLNLLKQGTDRLGFIENQLMRYNDQYLYDSAITEVEQEENKSTSNLEYQRALRHFLIWLYVERGLYQKALITAKRLENMEGNHFYAVLQVGLKLQSLNQFKLARQAFSYYVNKPGDPMAARSLEEIARLDIKWAKFYDKYHLDFGEKTDSLYHEAYRTIGELIQKYPNYDGMSSVMTMQTELALDNVKNVKAAEKFVQQLEKRPDVKQNQAMLNYLRGRIALYNENFERARVYFTRSNKIAHAGTLADKTRYFLSLTDFYAGDFDFAKIQIKALEKNSTSLYANNALQLRVWIQNGQIKDSTTTELKAFSRAQLLNSRGDTSAAVDTLLPYIETPYPRPLKDDMMLFVLKLIRNTNPILAFSLSDRYLNSGSGMLLEQIIWEHAQLANQIYHNRQLLARLHNRDYQFPVPDYFTKKNIDPLDEKSRNSILEIVSAKAANY